MGRSINIHPVSASSPIDGSTIVHQWCAVKSRNASYEFSSQRMPWLNQRKKKNLDSPCLGRRNNRDIAGVNVSELIAEKTNENTIVIANWL